MYKKILVPVDLADTDLAKPAIATAIEMARTSGGSVRLVNVLGDDARHAGGICTTRLRCAAA